MTDLSVSDFCVAQLYSAAKEFAEQTRILILDRFSAYASGGVKIGEAPADDSTASAILKADASVVTEVDLAAEKLLRELIGKRFPDHGIVGEEFPAVNKHSPFQWILDPIDGTNNFVHGVPTFGTIIGLHYQSTPLLGVIDHPALGLCYSGARGLGSYCNQQRLKIADCEALDAQEIICLGVRSNFTGSGHEHLFDTFMQRHANCRIYYDCFGLTRAIHGQVGAQVTFNLNLWDISPCQVLIEEAGGAYHTLATRQVGEKCLYHVIMGKPGIVRTIMPHFKL